MNTDHGAEFRATGEFVDRGRERDCRDWMIDADRAISTRVAAVTAALVLLFLPGDLIALGWGRRGLVAAATRIACAVFVAVVARGVSRSSDPSWNDRLWSAAASVMVIATLVIGTVRPLGALASVAAVTFGTFALYVVPVQPLLSRCALGTAMAVTVLWISTASSSLSFAERVALWSTLLATNLTGFFVARHWNRLDRRFYLVWQAEHVARQAADQALAEVRVLRGILPICMVCKRIHVGAETWESVEAYVSHRSEASFSHGLCPDCVDKAYPEFAAEN
jgi:hypothetical protein